MIFVYSSLQSESVIVTLISDEGGNPQVLETLISYMSSVLQQDIPTISLLSATLDRFGKFPDHQFT